MNDGPQFRFVFDVSQAFDISSGVTFEFCVSFFPTVTVPPVWLTRCWLLLTCDSIGRNTDWQDWATSQLRHVLYLDGRTDGRCADPYSSSAFFRIVTSNLLFPATFLSYRNMLFSSTAVYFCCLWRSTDMAEAAVLLAWIRKVASPNVDWPQDNSLFSSITPSRFWSNTWN